MSSLELQDVTHQLVQQFIAELADMLDDLLAGSTSVLQKKVLQKIVDFFDKEMKQHHLEEEGRIFPVLLERGDAVLAEKVRTMQDEHAQLRAGWLELKVAIGQALVTPGGQGTDLLACFERYSQCFAKHLVLEESIQFSPETRLLFSSWDS